MALVKSRLKIFLVDDDPFCRNMYLQHLENLGYKDITCFENGADCLAHLFLKPDVIFLDHSMGTLPGLTVLKKIKLFDPDIHVVFLSGSANIITAVKALKSGAIEYIVKGINEFENMTKVLSRIAEIKAS
ncbi:response regulator [Mucilaginibacter gotjawali]|uniref:Polysaccharide export outer membrane protein n=2 Tax=Mucilaginibacter gotjawali TaxID=1550579 RepID=A0A839SIR6_9SPHI|nr:response regulator [Mucilaginibacter gotjawali]MBB3058165.1 polysaccharide export outer membrane protein [Mucilaginibacter gotjawali]BAU54880.1 Tetrathionate response regulatory protein TtrR [Mucilaginibacter gotjawali]